MSSQQSKRTAVCTNPLTDSSLLTRILELAGPGHWLFLGAVCKAWRDTYAGIVEAAMQRQLPMDRASERTRVAGVCECKRPTHSGKYTAHSAVFASASCVRQAHSAGFRFDLESAAKSAGYYVDSDTLLQAHQLDLPYSDVLCQGIVERGDLALMQWLQEREPAVIADLLDDGMIVLRSCDDRPGRANFEGLFPSSDSQSSSVAKTPTHSSLFPRLVGSSTEHPLAALSLPSPEKLKLEKQSNAPVNLRCHHFSSPSFFGSVCKSPTRSSSPATPRRPSSESPNHDHELSHFSGFGDALCSPPMRRRTGPRRLDMVPAAIRSGNLELLLWLLQRGAKLSKDSLQQAAAAGHLHMVQYLCSTAGGSSELTESVTSAAASHQHSAVLQWLLSQNCPFDPCKICENVLADACDSYYVRSNVDAAAFYRWFLIEQGFTLPPALLSQLLNAAGAHGELAAAQALRSAGAAWLTELGCDTICFTRRIEDWFHGSKTPAVWGERELEWARGAGCTAPVKPLTAEFLAIEEIDIASVQITRVSGMYQS